MFRQCPHCKVDARLRARFCYLCGVELPESLPASAESRPGTVLFCDIVKSVQLAYRLDADDYHQVQQRVYRMVVDIARHHHGYVNRFVGDGAFVLFGFPAALEDSAEAAVRAGLDAVSSIAALPVPSGDALEMHVGIASGMVVMGGWTEGAMVDEVPVTGQVVNRAARLAGAAAPGSVLLCDATRRLVGQRFELEPLHALQLAGEPTSPVTWKALAETEKLSRFDARQLSGEAVALVGRAPLLATLRQSWQDATTGRGGMFLLSGDAGIGKSRLARAMQESLGGGGMHLDLHCMPRAQNAPLYAFGVLLRRLADVRPEDDEETALRKARAMLGLYLDPTAMSDAMRYLRELICPRALRQPSAESAEQERERTIGVIVHWLQALAIQQPLLLVVEDLQWTDATSAQVLRRLVEAARSLRLLVLATSRSEGEALVAGLDGVLTQQLEALDAGDAAQLVQHLAGEPGLPAQTVQTIVERADGNALFIEELTRAALEARDGQPSGVVPASLQNVIQARLDRLPSLRPLVQAAAVLGRDFAPHLLERLCPPATGAGLAEPVRLLIDNGILVPASPAGDAVLRFRHALIHDAVYQTLLRSDRQRLHRQAADLMEEDGTHGGGVGSGPPALLAHHWAQAGVPERAVPHLLQASRDTALRAAYDESIGHAQAGLRLVEQIGDTTLARRLRCALLAQQGHSSTATQGYAAPAVEAAFASALELCDDLTDPDELYPIVRGLGTYYLVRGRMQRADALARQCRQLAERAGRVNLRIDALAFAAYPAYYCGRLDESQQLLDQALELYRDADGSSFRYPNVQEPATAAWALLTTVAWLRGDLRASEHAADALMQHLRQLQSPFDDTFGLVWLAATRLLQRRFADAAGQAQAGLEVAKAHGFGTWIPAAAMQLFIASGALGASPDAAQTLQHVHQGFVAAGAEVSYPYYCWGIALALHKAGQLDAAVEAAERGLARATAGEETCMGGELHLMLARLHSQDPLRAQAHLRAAYEHACAQGAHAVALRALAALAAASDDVARAALASDCLAVLEGGAPLPDDADFVASRLRLLQSALQGSEQAVFEPHVQLAAAHVPVSGT